MKNEKIKGIILGPTTIGKTTLLDRLELEKNVKQISIGKLTREGGNIDPQIRKILQDCVTNKAPVLAEVAVKAVLPLIKYFSFAGESFFIDGTPRTVEEARQFIKEVTDLQSIPNVLISLVAEADILFQRIQKRIIENDRPEDFEIYRRRLEQYLENKEKILSFLKDYMNVLEFNVTNLSANEIYGIVINSLDLEQNNT